MLRLPQEARILLGDHKNEGKIAVLYGPLVLAADSALVPRFPAAGGEPVPLGAIAAAGSDLKSLRIRPEPAPAEFRTWAGARVFRMEAVTRRAVGSLKRGAPLEIHLIPFADAGGSGSDYKVWLPLPGSGSTSNLLAQASESRSREGNLDGAITDDDFQSAVVTFNNKTAAEDWFAVALDVPVTVRRIVFAHGKTFHDGGWFDASTSPPQIQVKLSKEGAWKTVGELTDYPATTATAAAGLKGGECFSCRLTAPMRIWAVRVIGTPACGDNPRQAFSSCAELQAFE